VIGRALNIRIQVISEKHPKLGTVLLQLVAASVTDGIFGGLALHDFAHRILNIRECWHVQGLVKAAQSNVGSYWPFPDVVVATERPTHLLLDKDYRPHSATDQAITYSDGFRAHTYHGTWIPPDAVTGTIDWKDVERVADPKMRDALVAMRAEKWSKETKKDETESERFDAAMAIKRLGGIEAVGELLGEKK
jgi:hypothetical protein